MNMREAVEARREALQDLEQQKLIYRMRNEARSRVLRSPTAINGKLLEHWESRFRWVLNEARRVAEIASVLRQAEIAIIGIRQ